VGGRIVLMKDDLFLFQTGSFLTNFVRLVWLKDWNNIPQLLFYAFQDNQQTKCLQHPKTLMP
jgi:hypothetical protein